ncbi:cytochrome P450 [Astrocystis sublimbata]|nr:cytochrome P450 [Astrocystis sublimbata]
MAGFVVAVFAGIFVTYIFVLALLQRTQNANEPPAIDTTIPSHLPMYTLRLPFVRLYVVNSPRLVQIVQKQVRTISFAPILVRMASTAMGVSQDAAKIISENHLSDDGFVHGVTAAIRPSLSPGPKLNALNRSAVQIIAASLDKVARHPTAVNPNLVEWVYRQVMIATMEGVYGPLHPFRDPDIQKAFLGFVKLMINILPALTARKSVQARNAMRSAFRRYFDDSAYEDLEASPLIKAKQATFWLIYHLYSDTELLAACRAELAEAIQDRGDTRLVDMACVRNKCPLLFSTFREVLRFYGIGISTRVVLEDTVLDNNFLVKKRGLIFIPGAGHHRLQSAWGEDADKFLARRSLKDNTKTGRGYDPVAFRAFGGGSTLCPGRHFAATEIMAFASLIVLRFDAQPSGGTWVPPTKQVLFSFL